MESEKIFIVLDDDNDYEIEEEYPHRIRRVGSDKFIAETLNKYNGYVYVKLNGKNYRKHRIVAKEFCYNDDKENKTQVDHVDRNKTNNHYENLRWVTPSENQKNRSSYKRQKIQYVDELPDDWVPVETYNGRDFEGYSYSPSEDKFYFDNGARIRIINLWDKWGYLCFKARDITGVYRDITAQKWKRDNGYD